ncbi:shTK domain protein [Teladorsagia circumcincta]|uniref:ShTK domain protein n=1 Tax=Teladorsagia circumcincta TaxID=45464 RepID=A0A2G9TM08_TELCI|nr:shTK domain protein [Teladorsagia circumcincta]
MTYDYGSIMHYGGTSASFNKKPTMVPFDVDYQQTLGSPFISFIELSMLNEHYKCKENCNPATSAKCEMGGFPHPRDCSKCICPGGYAGDRCTERPSGCGSTIQASSDWERLQDTLGFGYDEREDFLTCNYWIESPAGTEIEVRLLDFTSGLSIDGCKYAGVEIKTNKDQTLTGYRFCSPDAAGITLRSYTNRVPIMTYNRYLKTTTVLEYRHVPASAPRTTSPPSATTRASITTTTTKKPSSTAAFKCEDNHTCPSLVASGFCKGPLSEATKMKVCPKSCGLC